MTILKISVSILLAICATAISQDCVNDLCSCCRYSRCAWCSYGCKDGYWGDQCNLNCQEPCRTCAQSNGECNTCVDGYNIQWYYEQDKYMKYCDKCTCASCSWHCVECKLGYYKNGNICLRCPSTCTSCTHSTQCTQCIDGYSGQSCEQKCGANCRTCFSPSSCDSCFPGFYIAGTRCVECDAQCVNCQMGGCPACKEGYFLNDNRCFPCSIHCISCTSWPFCRSCRTGYYLFNGDCQPCINNCLSCSEKYRCEECSSGYFVTNGNCTACKPQCTSCNSTDQCTGCTAGFYLDYGYCKSCSADCLRCTSLRNCSSCDTGYYLQSGTCSKCRAGCNGCISLNHCTSCREGYYGYNCANDCPINCRRCTSFTVCSSCKEGFRGTQCQNPCDNCKPFTKCGQYSGYCITGCADGLSGQNCDNRCQSNCKSCLRNDTSLCTVCSYSTYGVYDSKKICGNQCSHTCLQSTCDDISGHCTFGCTTGYWGDMCQNSCSEQCQNATCIRENGSCLGSCYGNYTGSRCDCPPHCVCENTSECRGCEIGYGNIDKRCECTISQCTGQDCETCADARFYSERGACCACSKNCKNRQCASDSRCLNGCVDGMFGEDCSKSCKSLDTLCLSCIASNSKNVYSKCIECLPGNFPDDSGLCSKCPDTCKNETCNSRSGTCSYGCISGWWSNKCDLTCMENCLYCAQLDGICLACKNNRYLLNCSAKCSETCNSNEDLPACNISEGACLNGCIFDNLYGPYCNESCSSTCLDSKCDQLTGRCSAGCQNNTYGDYCEHDCKNTCVKLQKENSCSQTDGRCVGDCKSGQFGDMCDQQCSAGCRNASCVRQTGECLHGCYNGYEGITCSKVLAQENHASGVKIGGTAGAVAFFILLIVVIVIFVLRKRFRTAVERGDNGNGFMVHFSAAENEEPIHEDAVYAKPNKKRKAVGGAQDPVYEFAVDVEACSDKKPSVLYYNSVFKKSTNMKSDDGDETAQDSDGVLELEDPDENEILETMNNTKSHTKRPDLDNLYYNTAEVIRRRIPIHKLLEFVNGKTEENFEDEFKSLPEGLIKSYTESQKTENIAKNRYRGIYPYDSTRVVIRSGNSDYINASYIDGYKQLKGYIASIGPTVKYMGDLSVFWRMIWQERCEKVVMLTDLVESGVQKCDQYWPEKSATQSYADISVTCEREDVFSDYTRRTFTIKLKSEERRVTLMHFTSWPDKGVPKDVETVIEFRHRVDSLKTTLGGPTLVHCSAGVGRTGTYIALDSLTKEGESERSVDIFACVWNLREQRVHMVQTLAQYQFVHDAVVYALALNSHPVPVTEFQQYMQAHTNDTLAQEFLELEQSRRGNRETSAAKRNKSHRGKNKSEADMPEDGNSLRLRLQRKLGGSNYYSAAYINSYKRENRFILAKSPYHNTAVDFLTVVVQEEVSCIVSMELKKDLEVYLKADNQVLKENEMIMKTDSLRNCPGYTYRKLTIESENRTKHTVQHFQLTSWPEELRHPKDAAEFVQFVKQVELKANATGPILIHCLDGASRSGLFCCVFLLLEKTESDQEISVLNTVSQVKASRYTAISDKEQYIFCHQCVSQYIRSFDTYANFDVQRS